MERLTEKRPEEFKLKELKGALCNDYCEEQSCSTCEDCAIYKAIQKLAYYEDMEEKGKLRILPCKPGDTVYVPHRGRIQKMTVTTASIDKFGQWNFGWELKDGKGVYSRLNGFSLELIGKTVFLTEHEAHEALQKMKGE